MLWTELLFSYFPIDKKIFWQQMLARFCFLFSVWLIGLLAYALEGQMTSYIIDLGGYTNLFGTGFLVLFGSYSAQRKLNDIIQNVRPMLKLDDPQFQKFSERLERYSYSFLPCLFITIAFVVMGFGILLTGAPIEFQQAWAEGLRLIVIWFLLAQIFLWLLTATGIWMVVSIWLTIFLISRQPLNVELSPETIEKFRGLSILALWFSLFYFLGVSIANVLFLASAPALSLLEIVVSPYFFFIAIGIIGVLFPFYNIHNALLKLKKQELLIIEEESEQLLQQLDEVLAKQPTRQISDQTITIMARLFSLQIKERHVKAAQEWPIDIGFLTKLIAVGLIPIIARIAAQIFTRYF
jgi:hypothetical protein